MIKEITITVVAGVVLFEIIEHVVFPLVWSITQKRKPSICDVSAMVGKVGEVTRWRDLEGKLFVNGETWNARSDMPLSPGDNAVIERVDGFVLEVKKTPSVSHSRERN
jgi:membrane-bound serine protease (ClpP class)